MTVAPGGMIADRLNLSAGDYHQTGFRQCTANAIEQPRGFDGIDSCLGIQEVRKAQQDKCDFLGLWQPA
jgi:hypothetical protein